MWREKNKSVKLFHKSFCNKKAQFFIFLCLPYFFNKLRTPKMTLWAYAQEPNKWPSEHMLKDPKNDPLRIHSRTQKLTLWAYAQGPKKWPFEHTLNCCVSVRSIAVWACAQGPKKLPFECTLNRCVSVCSIAVWAYAQGPQKCS